jgi:hypothetical protein
MVGPPKSWALIALRAKPTVLGAEKLKRNGLKRVATKKRKCPGNVLARVHFFTRVHRRWEMPGCPWWETRRNFPVPPRVLRLVRE